jgi:hypothetical protein
VILIKNMISLLVNMKRSTNQLKEILDKMQLHSNHQVQGDPKFFGHFLILLLCQNLKTNFSNFYQV